MGESSSSVSGKKNTNQLDPTSSISASPSLLRRNAVVVVAMLIIAAVWAAYGFLYLAKKLDDQKAIEIIESIHIYFSTKSWERGGGCIIGAVCALVVAGLIDRLRGRSVSQPKSETNPPKKPLLSQPDQNCSSLIDSLSSNISFEAAKTSVIPLSNAPQAVVTKERDKWNLHEITEEELQQMIQGKSVTTEATGDEIQNNNLVEDKVVIAKKEGIEPMPISASYIKGVLISDQGENGGHWELRACCRQGTKYRIWITHRQVCGGCPTQLYMRESQTGKHQYFIAWPDFKPILPPSNKPPLPLMVVEKKKGIE